MFFIVFFRMGGLYKMSPLPPPSLPKVNIISNCSCMEMLLSDWMHKTIYICELRLGLTRMCCIFAQTFLYFTIKQGCHHRVVLVEICFEKIIEITRLSWLFFTKISKDLSKYSFDHHNMLVFLLIFLKKWPWE